ncbi:hypothetical protein [Peterkaempfera bronchialis]|uniref:DUF8083 domain-containing protein n=1 Tax=Peterkaempfera bronchialis TaxID=2126346 RepID=A0A345SXF4_9ACTN|nr:hypothetical protein [Peterkaempfera bronchialis]AXI78409.1 hypothetical protein C7M71_014180 [Peterkaempfera bronchialis]
MPCVTAVRTSVLPPYAAYLRVYEPLAAFPEAERAHWQAYAAQRGAYAASPDTAPSALDERRRSLAELVTVTPKALPERESRDALVRVADGVTYVCPSRIRLRSWLALEELKEDLPAPLLDAVLPPAVREQAEADWERWRGDHPDTRPWILTRTWHVPVRWFLLFSEDDRHFSPSLPPAPPTAAPSRLSPPSTPSAPEGADSGDRRSAPPALYYLTPMAQARRRLARGYRVLRENLEEGPLVSGVEQVGRWLEEFHPRSLVELDYGGLVHAIPEQRLAEDRSAAEVAEGIAALRAGDGTRAGVVYRTVTERWRAVRERLYAN